MLRNLVPTILVPTILFAVAPSMAATLTCAADGARIEGTTAAQVDVALDGHLYRLANPNALKPLPGADRDADRVCAARLGMVAIVLPAPKPGPDETSRATEPLMLRLRATALSLEDPYAQAPDGFGDDDLSDLSDLEVEAVAEAPAPGEAEAESPAEGTPAESGSDVIPGAAAPEGPSCSSTGDGSPTGLAGMALLLALGLVRRRLGGGR